MIRAKVSHYDVDTAIDLIFMDPEKESCGISFTSKEKNYCFDENKLSIVVGLIAIGNYIFMFGEVILK